MAVYKYVETIWAVSRETEGIVTYCAATSWSGRELHPKEPQQEDGKYEMKYRTVKRTAYEQPNHLMWLLNGEIKITLMVDAVIQKQILFYCTRMLVCIKAL